MFEFKDSHGDSLVVEAVGVEPKSTSFKIKDGYDGDLSIDVVVPFDALPGLVESIFEVTGYDNYVIPKSGDKVEAYRGWLYCGSGKEYMETPETSDPAVLLAQAANLVTIAKEIQRRKAVAVAEQSLEARRDKVTQELAGNPKARYELATDLAKKGINRIIELEDKQKENENA